MGRCRPRQKLGVNLQEENPPQRPTLSRAALSGARPNYADLLSNVLTSD